MQAHLDTERGRRSQRQERRRRREVKKQPTDTHRRYQNEERHCTTLQPPLMDRGCELTESSCISFVWPHLWRRGKKRKQKANRSLKDVNHLMMPMLRSCGPCCPRQRKPLACRFPANVYCNSVVEPCPELRHCSDTRGDGVGDRRCFVTHRNANRGQTCSRSRRRAPV
ncbi:Hypothetical protein SMAX5B_018435 [Scophthalmus maximus]|uniref:Uncharacterized protein n=1 Tax=Scophthalmus maximus TaxID=52904 RepID=A0A2U9CA17_SCOMX|nr:Hypothetical protein SMAX5B_018435 [Scophthalmus maximus]